MNRSDWMPIVVMGALAGAACAQPSCDPAEVTVFAAPEPEANDQLGFAVALAGDLAVAGARFDDDMGADAGAAYVLRFDGATWVQEAKLVAPDGAPQDSFGFAAGAAGDRVVVGAPNDDDNGSNSGAAYVFRFDGVSWVEEAKLRAPDAAGGDLFGWSVAIAGDRVIVGAQFDSHDVVAAGSAYVFRFDGAGWAQEAKLVASDAALGDRFGFSCALAGDAALIGAVTKNAAGEGSGAAYVFRFDGSGWIQEARLVPATLGTADQFGRSVALSPAGTLALIGAANDDDVAEDAGAAYVYRFDGAWTEEAKLTPSDGGRADWFGWSVSIDDAGEGRALMGAHQRDGAARAPFLRILRS